MSIGNQRVRRNGSVYKEDDMIILVIGPTGSGKSTFIKIATGQNVEVSVKTDLRPCTKSVQAYRCRHPDNTRDIVFVDTPGNDEVNIMPDIQTWFEAEKYYCSTPFVLIDLNDFFSGRNIGFSGILYLYGISAGGMKGSVQNSFKRFEYCCQSGVFPRVVLATTMWDEVDLISEGSQQESLLRDNLWKTMRKNGSKIYRINPTSPLEVVEQFPLDESRVIIVDNKMMFRPGITQSEIRNDDSESASCCIVQ